MPYTVTYLCGTACVQEANVRRKYRTILDQAVKQTTGLLKMAQPSLSEKTIARKLNMDEGGVEVSLWIRNIT